MPATASAYESQNAAQRVSEHDPFTEARYRQFARHLNTNAHCALDVGCNTGRGGLALKGLRPGLVLDGLDCVQARLDALPACYARRIHGLSTLIPAQDQSYDAVLAGEFLEHLYPADVDPTLCEFQRILVVGGLLLLTTPNPGYLKNALLHRSVFGVSHLTQHHPSILKHRLLMHGFGRVRIRGSGKLSSLVGERFPWLSVYGSYLMAALKF